MEQIPVNFKQVRDFGEIFNATFSFIRQEFNSLLKSIVYYALPLLVITAIIGVLINIEQQRFTNSIVLADPANMEGQLSSLGGLYLYYFLYIIVHVLGLSALQCTVLGYIRQYVLKGKGNFTHEDVWAEVKKNIFPVLGISLLVSILIVIGFILCIIPGIYLAVSLSLILSIYVFEQISFGDAFNRSFRLISKKWWLTFGIIIIFYVILYLAMLLLSIPSVLMGLKTFLGVFKNPGTPTEFSTAFYIVNSITSMLTYVLFTIPIIGITLHYFSLVESTEKTSLHDKIEQIA